MQYLKSYCRLYYSQQFFCFAAIYSQNERTQFCVYSQSAQMPYCKKVEQICENWKRVNKANICGVAANIESRKKEKISEYPFVEKKNIFKIRLITYFFKITRLIKK